MKTILEIFSKRDPQQKEEKAVRRRRRERPLLSDIHPAAGLRGRGQQQP